MDITALPDKYLLAVAGVAGSVLTLIGTLAGAALTSWFNLKAKEREAANARHMRLLDSSIEFQQRHLIEPVIAFLEADLRLISDVYARRLENDASDRKPELSEHVRLLAMVEARLATFGDPALESSFRLFSRKRLDLGNKLFDERRSDVNGAYKELQEAIRLASEILASMKRTLERA